MTATARLESIRADFEMLDEWEDRYRYLIELGKDLAPLDEGDRTDTNKVRGCASQVWLATRIEPHPDGPRLHFKGDSDAHIVKGLIAIVFAMFDGQPAKDIGGIDAHAIFAEMGLAGHLTPQRSNGFAAMVSRIRSDAEVALAA